MITKLSKNEKIVLSLLERENKPLTAYTILDNLNEYGFRAPLQVYRALEKLIEKGKVHRIESKNSFVACNISNCSSLDFTAFAICDECDNVKEIEDNSIVKTLSKLKKITGFETTRSNIEFHGLCKNCNSI